MRLLILCLFFLSGACGLVYQIVWVRMLTHVFGTTATAVGIVLAAFMAGLALGSWLLGRNADRSSNPLRFYALLEFGIGITALVAHWLLTQITPAYLALYEMTAGTGFLLEPARFILAFALVMAPTLLMGATLPVLVRFFLRRLEGVGADLGTLYAVNTVGAVFGVLACGFWLIGVFGLHVTVAIAVAGNLLLGLAALIASRRTPPLPAPAPATTGVDPDATRSPSPAPPDRGWIILLVALFLSGLTSFAYEIYWTRSLVFLLGNSTYALSTMLTAFIAGIALGSYLARLVVDRDIDRMALFGWIQILIGLTSAVALPLLFAAVDPQVLRGWLGQTSGNVELQLAGRFAIALLVMLLPATLIGATFPLIGRIAVVDLGEAGSRIGRVYAANTLGNVAGALLPGFVLLYWLGIQRGILLMAAINILLGIGFLAARLVRRRYLRWAMPAATVAALAVLTLIPLDFQFPSENESPRHEVLYYRDGPSATTRVTVEPRRGSKEMSIDGIVIGGNTFTEYKQLLLAHLPKLLRDDVSTELSIGFGTGMLVGESLRYARVRQLTCVEIEPSVVEAAAHFADLNHRVLSNPRLRVVLDDVSNYLRVNEDRYRVISADEKTSLDYASNGFSYSVEYYRLLRERLAPGGILIQWVPANLPPRQYRMVLKTFSRSFAHVAMAFFMPALKESGYNTILIGSDAEILLDSNRIERALASESREFAALARYGLTSPATILAQFVAGGETLRRAVADAELNTLVHPRYEFYAPHDYAVPLRQRVAANLGFIARLRREGAAELRASMRLTGAAQAERLDAALVAEQAFLEGYRISLGPVNATDIFAHYDAALAGAPWNDSLRERIALHYMDIAASQTNPGVRNYLLRRAADARGTD